MNLQLKRLRKQAGFKRQADIAKALGIPERRYASWEREEVMMSLEQACMVTKLLGCTLEELVGREPRIESNTFDERALIGLYRATTDAGRQTITNVAKQFSEVMPRGSLEYSSPEELEDVPHREITDEDYKEYEENLRRRYSE